MRYYPIYLDLKGRPVLMVGGGPIAEGKAEQLLAAGADLLLVSPDLTPRLTALAAEGAIRYRAGRFAESDLQGVWLVISATDDREVNEDVHRLASARNLLCNVVDQPPLCNFITPALVTRGDLQISISSGGVSPSVAQLAKRRIADIIGEEYGELLALAGRLREHLKSQGVGYNERRDVLNAFLESNILDLLREGRREDAEQLVAEVERQHSTAP